MLELLLSACAAGSVGGKWNKTNEMRVVEGGLSESAEMGFGWVT